MLQSNRKRIGNVHAYKEVAEVFMKRMTWDEIKTNFPNQCVGLVQVETGINGISVKSAIVKWILRFIKFCLRKTIVSEMRISK